MTSQTYAHAQEVHASDSMPASGSSSPLSSLSKPPPNQTGDVWTRDQVLQKLLVQMTLRLRLRGVDLESSTGLSGRELDLVALVVSSGPTSVKSLVADLGLPRSTMTAIVDRLEARGLIKRLPNPQDRRSVILEATPSALEALLRYQDGMLDFAQHLRAILGQEEQAQLIHLIQKIDESF
jgi:DNA-binding MarR family transcriptional regulator